MILKLCQNKENNFGQKSEIQNYLDGILEEENFDADVFSDYFFEILNQKGLISYDNKTVADFYI